MDRRDEALFSGCPMVVAPVFGTLPVLAVGERRIVAGRTGLFIEARSPALHLRARIAVATLPYGDVEPMVAPSAGPIPKHLFREFIAAAGELPEESARLIVLAADGYAAIEPSISSRSPVHISYDDSAVDDDALVFDIHSHGQLAAVFSSTDDRSDLSRRGPYIAVVIGRLGQQEPQVSARLVVPPYLIPVSMESLFDNGVIE